MKLEYKSIKYKINESNRIIYQKRHSDIEEKMQPIYKPGSVPLR